MKMLQRIPALAMVCVLQVLLLRLAQGFFIAQWRFDILNAAHWDYFRTSLLRWWSTGQGMRLDFFAAIMAAAIFALAITWLGLRQSERVNRLIVTIAWRPVRFLCAAFWRMIARPMLAWLAALAGGMFVSLADRLSSPVRQSYPDDEFDLPPPVFAARKQTPQPEAVSVNATAPAAAPAAPPSAVSKAPQPTAARTAAAKETAVPAPAAPRSGIDLSAPSDADLGIDESAVAGEVGAAETDEAIVGFEIDKSTALWLGSRKWELLHHLPVNGNLQGSFLAETDLFDTDPHALIPIVALSGTEIRLIFPVDLKGVLWKASPWDPDRSGVPDWTAEDGSGELIPCPVAKAMRACQRFIAAHEAALNTIAGLSVHQVYPAIVLANGDVENWTELETSWPEGTIAHLERPNALEYAFGADPVEDAVEPTLMQYLREAGSEALQSRAA